MVEASHPDDKDPPVPTPQQPEVAVEPDKLPAPEQTEAAIAEEIPSDTPISTATEALAAEEQAPNDTPVPTETEAATEA